MNLRDLKPSALRHLAQESEDEYEKWQRETEGLTFGSREPLTTKEIWRVAYSKGVSAVLKRVDNLREP